MSTVCVASAAASRTTRRTYIWSSLLSVPLLAAYNFAGVILYRDLGASAFQVALLSMVRPAVALLALYWSFAVAGRSDRLLPNLVWSGLLARLPFFLCPFLESPWVFIAVAACYMLLSRGGIPAWMELFRRNLPKKDHSRVFSSGSSWGYVEGIALAIAIGMILDGYQEAWRWIFPVAALVGLGGVFLQACLPLAPDLVPRVVSKRPKERVRDLLTAPWRDAWRLMQERRDFRIFQWGFMICGAAMMVIQPALPFFFVDVLGVTYTELAVALAICKGLGFAVTSPWWARRWKEVSVFRFSTAIFVIVALFPLCLLFAPWGRTYLYLGYLCYGVAQAGSEMCWHLSGTVFARGGDSSLYTGVNVAMVGVRGALIPPLGGLLCLLTGPLVVFGLAVGLSLLGSVVMLVGERPYRIGAVIR